MLIKVFQLFQTCLVICLSVTCQFNNLVIQEAAVYILIRKMILPLDNQKQKDILTLAINISNCYSLFLITWLNCLTSVILICIYNNHYRTNHTYYKACFVKVIEIIIQNVIFCPYILHKSKPYANQLRIFVQGPLEIINMIKTRLKGWLLLYKSIRLELANTFPSL